MPTPHAPTLLVDLAMVTGVAAVTGLVARRLGQPRILGYLFAGLVVGPSIPIPLFADPHRIESLAEVGVVLVLFAVGLEFRLERFAQVLPTAGLTAVLEVAFLGWCGYSVGGLLGWSGTASVFLGAALAISSTMVVSGLFEQRPVDEDVRRHVLGVLVVQDLVAIVFIAALTALSEGQDLELGALGGLLVRLTGVLAVLLLAGLVVVRPLVRSVVLAREAESTAVVVVGVAFVFAALAALAGFSVALGAFVAGIAVAESGVGHEVGRILQPLRTVFAAIFFVSIGMAVDPLAAWQHLPTAIVVTVVVIVAQLVSVSGSSLLSGLPLRRSVLSGLALGQIGELSFIFAAIGAAGGVVPDALLPVLVTVATFTTFTTPWLLDRGPRLVAWLDRTLPPRVQHLLAVHEASMERIRATSGPGTPVRRALRDIVLDWIALVVLGAVVFAVRDPASVALEQRLGLTPWAIARLVDGVVLIAASLPLVGLVRTARRLARGVAEDVSMDASSVGARLVEALLRLVLLVGVGVPALAILRPMFDSPWAEPVLAVLIVGAVVLVLRNLGAMEGEFRSGASTLARQLSSASDPDPEPWIAGVTLPGLDHPICVVLDGESPGVGRTLADLDLRAITGTTVLAITRGADRVVLPMGDEQLRAGDRVALAGWGEGLARAKELLIARS